MDALQDAGPPGKPKKTGPDVPGACHTCGQDAEIEMEGKELVRVLPPRLGFLLRGVRKGREAGLRLCRGVLPREFRGVAQVPDGGPGADDGDEDEQGEEQAEKGFHRVAGDCSVFAGSGKGRFRNGGC